MFLEMFFMKLSDADISFDNKTFMLRIFTTKKALPTTKQVEIIDEKNFLVAVLDANSKIFVMHIAIQKYKKISVHFERQA